MGEITKLAKFLEVEANNDLVKDIAVKCSFSNMKKAAGSKQETFAINNKEVAQKITNFTHRKGMKSLSHFLFIHLYLFYFLYSTSPRN